MILGSRQSRQGSKFSSVTGKMIIWGIGILFLPSVAFALGTAAGTTINNSASVGYSVGGVAQTPAASNVATFVVDNKVVFTLIANDATYVSVVPGQTGAVLTYTLLNSGNATQDFGLTVTNQTTGTATVFTGLDTFDPSSSLAFVESGATAGYQSAQDTATYVDELLADTSKVIYVVSTIGSSRVNNDIAGIKLEAQARVGGTGGTQGIVLAQTAGADTAGSVDVVWADAAGTGGDSARDGKYAALDAYKVVTAALLIVKTSAVINDPINSTTNPKRIPGSLIEYTIVITNNGGAASTSVSLTDPIPANMTYSAGTIKVDGVSKTDAADADSGTFSGGVVTGTFASIALGGGTGTVVFRATVN